jgi:hypothetical protein
MNRTGKAALGFGPFHPSSFVLHPFKSWTGS